MKRSWLVGGAVLAALVMVVGAGCGAKWQNCDEQFVRAGVTGGQNVPEWVQGRMPTSDTEIFFVGRSVGCNVLDEKAAYETAMNDALEQMGKQVATWVKTRAVDCDARYFTGGNGCRFLPGEKCAQKVAMCSKLTSQALAGDMVPRDVYWEKWAISAKGCPVMGGKQQMQSYKCWVLMSVSKKAMMDRTAATLAALKVVDAGSATVYSVVGDFKGTGATPLCPAGAAKLCVMSH